MKTIAFTRNNALRRKTGMLAVSLLTMGVLSACSDSGTDGVDTVATADSTAPLSTPGAVRPSRSAAELSSDDSSVTLQTAIAQLNGNTTSEQATVGAPAAANPFDTADEETQTSTDVPASSPDNSVTSETDTDTGTDTGSDTDNATVDESSDATSSETVSEETTDTPAESAEVVSRDLVDPESAAMSALSLDNNDPERFFVSVTTPGFEGEVLDDAIRITWLEDPTARGYNIYKQAEYYLTVFSTEFIDTDVYDDDYYYEIQAFDYDDQFSYIATGLTVSPRTFGRTDPDAPQPVENLLDDYELIFSDEFNASSLDLGKWNTSFIWGTDLIINSEEQYYVDIANDPDFGFNPFTFDGSHLTINTIETPAEMVSQANDQPYLSGIITSYDSFKFTYGYIETRAKFTHGRGYWPAFWLLNAYYVDAKPEIDIMEFIGHNQDVMYHTYHYFDENDELRSTQSNPVPGTDYTEDFHTFAVEWKPGELIFYVDGIETQRIVDINVSQQEMYVLANQAVGGWWAGSPDETTPLPGKYVIDYIRVYERTTPYEDIQFDQQTDVIPLYVDQPGFILPNKRPPIWLWPEGYSNAR